VEKGRRKGLGDKEDKPNNAFPVEDEERTERGKKRLFRGGGIGERGRNHGLQEGV